ncbi:O-antigen ligase family protein [Cellulophaga sp. F20128]|uniref:O-antigen ligase family protein n=1 Tax=Cellulophaga sp. F20128 TaxID=2926413 RepID=UPI001FF41AE9|nr:O-antigen ligase family protein [Cellulophaga sp. F20128]MCK0158136.1 O-antigen ligase family protein [Cellulophaga sp. F20128]
MQIIIKYEKVPYFLLIALAFFPILPYGVISAITIIYVIATLLIFRRNLFENFQKKRVLLLITNTLFFVLFAFTFIYSENKELAYKEIIKNLNFLIFPTLLILFFPKLSKDKIDKVFKSFVLSNLTLLLILLIAFANKIIFQGGNLTFSNFLFRDLLIGGTYLDLHPTYVSLWFAFSIQYLILNFFTLTSRLHKFVILLISVLFYFTIILLASRTVFLAINIILILNIIIKFKTYRITRTQILFFLSFLSFIIFIKDFKNIHHRFYTEIASFQFNNPMGRNPTSLDIRYGIYKCNIKLFCEEPIFGYGIGDVQESLNNCYKIYRTSVFKWKKMDSHNYFFFLLIGGGLISLFTFLFMIFSNFKKAYSEKDLFFLSFLILIIFCCLTENLLNRVHGNLFFSLFNSLFIYKLLIQEENNAVN